MPSQENYNKQEENQVPISYACMPRPILSLGSLSVQAVQEYHIEDIRQWRNAQMNILRQSTLITPDEQKNYFQKHIWTDMPSLHPKNILLAYMEDDHFIGYGGLVHIAWEHLRAEVSFLLSNNLAGTAEDFQQYFPTFLQLMKILAFEDLKLERLCTETYSIRPEYISVLENSGFEREGILTNHIRIKNKPFNSFIHGCVKK